MASISFQPDETDFQLYRGNNIVLGTTTNPCTLTEGDGVTPINMSGGTLIAQIRAAQDPTSSLIAAFDVTWVNQAEGQFILSIPAATTASGTFAAFFAASPEAYWDITFIDCNTPPNVTTLTHGVVTLMNDVSN